jgi:hypothetical protein
VIKGVKKDPAQRFQSVAEMVDRLRRRREGDIPIQCAFTLLKRANFAIGRFIDRHPFIAGGAVMVSIAATIGLSIRALL